MPASLTGDVTTGAILNQGSVSAGANLHFGNVNNYGIAQADGNMYQKCLRELLRTLPDDPRDHKESLITRKGRWLKGTCEWILKSQAYMDWLNPDKRSQLLWITGDPGKGKTMLSLFLINHREMVVKKDRHKRKLVFFFCAAQEGRNTGESILRGLVYQLLADSRGMFRHIQNAYTYHGSRLFDDGQFESLWRVFDSMVRDDSLDSVTCVLDGLDECVEETLTPLFIKIRGLFTAASPAPEDQPEAKLKMILTSRNYPDTFENFLHTFPRLKLEPDFNDAIKKDVGTYIDHRMEELACAKRLKPEFNTLRENIKDQLVRGSNGTYLWINFAINSLKKEICPNLENAVSEFPQGLDAMYKRMLLSIPESKRGIICSILHWVVNAFRPLRLEELGTALDLPRAVGQDIEDSVADFVSCAGNLLIVIPETSKEPSGPRVVVPVHASATDFIRSIQGNQGELGEFLLDTTACHKMIAYRTLDYAMGIFQQVPDLNVPKPSDAKYYQPYRQHAFLEYSLTSSLRHVVFAMHEARDPIHPLMDESCPVHQPWLRAQALAASYLFIPGNIGLVHLAALLGHLRIIERCLQNFPQLLDARDQYHRTPLFYAVLRGHNAVVAYLLHAGADANARDVIGQMPLHIACANQDENIVAELLAANADINASCSAKESTWEGEVQGSMLDHYRIPDSDGVDWDESPEKINDTGAPLHFAATYDHHNVIKLLLDNGADINVVDDKGRTALHRATATYPDADDSVIALVQAGINMFATDDSGQTAFHIAAEGDSITQLETMMDAGFPVDYPTEMTALSCGGVTALQVACSGETNFYEVVMALIRRGAQVDHYDSQGRTALHWLALRPKSSFSDENVICSKLLQNMAESAIFAKDSEGCTAYDLAIKAEEERRKRLEQKESEPSDIWNFRKLYWTPLDRPLFEQIHRRMTAIQREMLPDEENWLNEELKNCSRKVRKRVARLTRQRLDYRARLAQMDR